MNIASWSSVAFGATVRLINAILRSSRLAISFMALPSASWNFEGNRNYRSGQAHRHSRAQMHGSRPRDRAGADAGCLLASRRVARARMRVVVPGLQLRNRRSSLRARPCTVADVRPCSLLFEVAFDPLNGD